MFVGGQQQQNPLAQYNIRQYDDGTMEMQRANTGKYFYHIFSIITYLQRGRYDLITIEYYLFLLSIYLKLMVTIIRKLSGF